MNTIRPAIVFSAWQARESETQNRLNVDWVKRQLTKSSIGYRVACGCYRGDLEPSIVLADTGDAIATVRRFARLFKQESILRIDANGLSRLEDCDGNTLQNLGKLREVPEQIAKARDSWTRVGDKFYITVDFSTA